MLYNQINCHTHFLSSAKRRNSAPIETRSLGWTPLPLTLRYKILNLYKIASIVINVTYSIPVKNKCKGMYIYSVFFFIESKVFVNLTYLYLSEIKKQGLIFSVGMGHLIICKKNVDLDREFLSKPVFLLYACRASVELWIGKRFQSSWTWPYS